MTDDAPHTDEFDSLASAVLSGAMTMSSVTATFGEAQATPEPDTTQPPRPVSMPSGQLEGLELGPYVLGPEIGRGGMGRIHTARNEGRQVAVKLFRPHPRFLRNNRIDILAQRFLREAVVAASLRDPHTVELLDAGQTGDGVLFYVMEYLDGASVWERLQADGPFEPERAIHVTLGVCQSLEELHDRRYVHRDVKPQNVMLVERGGDDDFAKLLDFGLVRTIQGADEYGDLTAPGTSVGTPAFAAPEQVLHGESVDQRADVYSLALLLFTMLAGHPPFRGETAKQVMIAQARQAPPRVIDLRHDIANGPGLQAVLDRALAKARTERYESARALASALSLV